MHPLLILVISIAVVVLLIIRVKLNAFIALILAAATVGVLSKDIVLGDVFGGVTVEFGITAGKIGVLIAMAALIGQCLMESGAADKITRRFVAVLGEKNASLSMLVSGFVLSIPVFFDTVFYLLVPLARALRVRTGKNYLLFVMAICAGGAVTHVMVPPTPGPLAIASELGIEVGTFIIAGLVVGCPMALAGWLFSRWVDARMPVELRETSGMTLEELRLLASKDETDLPPFWLSILPIVLPVLMITSHTVAYALREKYAFAAALLPATSFIGNANFALIVAAAIAMATLAWKKKYSLAQLGQSMEPALASAGLIILITAAGGAYGGLLKAAKVGDELQALATNWGVPMIAMGFLLAVLLKVAQGSSTGAMMTTVSILAAMIQSAPPSYHIVYIGLAIACGSLVGSWMNDSGFWVYKQMSGLTEKEALRSWTPLLAVLGIVGFLGTLLGSMILPLKSVAP